MLGLSSGCGSGCHPQENRLGCESQSCATARMLWVPASCSVSLQERQAVQKQPLPAPGPVTGPLAAMLGNALVDSCAASRSPFLPTGSRPALRLCRPVLSPGKGPPATLAAGYLAGNGEPLAVTAPEGAGKDATASRAEVEGVEKAATTGEVESPEGAGPGGKVVTPEGAAVIVVEASENPEAERIAEAFARAAERIAISEAAKVLQSAIAEVETSAASGSRWGEGAVGARSPWLGSLRPDGMGGCSSSTEAKPGLSALPSECLRWMGLYFCLALSCGERSLFWKNCKQSKKKKSLKFLLRVCAPFPSGFPLPSDELFFHDSGHFITPGIVKDTKHSPLQPLWPHAHPVLKHSYLGIKKGPRVVFTQPRIFI